MCGQLPGRVRTSSAILVILAAFFGTNGRSSEWRLSALASLARDVSKQIEGSPSPTRLARLEPLVRRASDGPGASEAAANGGTTSPNASDTSWATSSATSKLGRGGGGGPSPATSYLASDDTRHVRHSEAGKCTAYV